MKRRSPKSVPVRTPPFPPLPAVLAVLAVPALMAAGCSPHPPGPDLGPFAGAVKWLGTCLVLSSLIWAVGIVLFGRSRPK